MSKSIIDVIESNKKVLRAEYQKGYLVGFKEAEKRTISDILKDLEEFELKRYSDMIRTLKKIREKLEGKLKNH